MEQEHILNTYFDTLKEWYENAERITKTNLPNDGDTTIYPHGGGVGYVIEKSEGGWTPDIIRILSRAPKPTPAWHDAAAVVAVTPASPSRGVLVRAGDGEWYSYRWNRYVKSDDLIDPVPLIEAKVTDGMLLRYLNHSWGVAESSVDAFEEVEAHVAREALTAVLGLETA